jgi:transposase
MEIHTIGIDLGKTVFHLVGLDAHGEVVVRKKCSRDQILRFTANLDVSLIGMEACGGAHFLARALREQGHDARLMPAKYVKPYVKTNKNDYIDAEAKSKAEGDRLLPWTVLPRPCGPSCWPGQLPPPECACGR